jgi:leader peptidase (prepilin peptidase) / N-methyltransferase
VILISSTADLWFFAVSAFLFGLVFGSFLNVCIYRLPQGLSVVTPRSACPHCHAPIAAYDNIPVLSWLWLRGRCRSCEARISPRYWIVELLTGIFFALCIFRFGANLEAIKFCIFSFLLLGLILTDADTQLLPDVLTLPGLALGLAFCPFVSVGGLMGFVYRITEIETVHPQIESVVSSVAGAVLAGGFIFLIGELWYRLRGVEAMGFGDVKLMAMVGAFLGPKLALLTILLGSFAGAATGMFLAARAYSKRMKRWKAAPSEVARQKAQRAVDTIMRRFPLPFGVFLGGGALASAFFGNPLMAWYAGLFQ